MLVKRGLTPAWDHPTPRAGPGDAPGDAPTPRGPLGFFQPLSPHPTPGTPGFGSVNHPPHPPGAGIWGLSRGFDGSRAQGIN